MPLPDDPVLPGTLFEVIYRYTVNNQICMAVLHYAYTQGGTVTSYIDATIHLATKLADVASNVLLNNMAAAQAANVTYLDVSAQVVWPNRFLKFTEDLAKVGQVAAGAQAQNIAGVISKQTKVAARYGVGNLHLGGVPGDAFIQGLFITDHMTRLNLVATSLLLDINLVADGILLHPALMNKTPIPDTDPVKYEISGFILLYTTTARREVRVMRRRTVGLGI